MRIFSETIDRARSVDMLDLAGRYTKLKKNAANESAGPCPRCFGRDRFSVNVREGLWNCRGCGKGGDAIALIQHLEGVGFAEAVEELAGQWTSPPPRPRQPRPASKEEDAERNTRRALNIWDGARSIRGTLAEPYLLRWRNIDIDQIPDLDEVLRFELHCQFGTDRLPCLISLVRNILSDAPQAIQRTALGPDGQKIDRMGLGPKTGGAIKLWPDSEVTSGLVVGEGAETVAAAASRIEHRGTILQPAWALIDSAGLGGFPVLAGLDAITILTDADENGAGQRAADECERRWLEAGREVTRLTPKKLGSDFADIVAGAGP